MRQYELVVLLHPDLEIDVDSPISKLEKLIESVGGKVVKRDNWGKKRLAYRVKKHDFAVYVAFELQISPDKVRQLENSILLTEEVIRHILVSKIEVPVRQPAKTRTTKAAPEVEQEAKAEVKEEAS